MSLVETGTIKFEFDMQPKYIYSPDGSNRKEWETGAWWDTSYDMQVNDFSLIAEDAYINGFTELVLEPFVKLDAAFVQADGTWLYYTWYNGTTREQIWDLTTLGQFDNGYVGATFDYMSTANSIQVPHGSYMNVTTTNAIVPAPGALCLLAVSVLALCMGYRKRD